jgi:hypothetical protein
MLRTPYIAFLAAALSLVNIACASDANQVAPTVAEPNRQSLTASPVDDILTRLNRNLADLKSCRLELSWKYTQPLLETSTTRKGILLYLQGKERSRLRINFTSFQQDKEPAQPLREEIIFDGVWLTRIDYQLKEIKRDQLARDEKPIHAFQLLSGKIPLIGFGSVDDLKKQFGIMLAEKSTDTIHLVLTPRPDSEYKKDYKTIDIYTKASAALPERIQAVTPDDDISEITLAVAGPQEVKESAFESEAPRDFTIISKPLKDETVQ